LQSGKTKQHEPYFARSLPTIWFWSGDCDIIGVSNMQESLREV
jgi:hypothetical protein